MATVRQAMELRGHAAAVNDQSDPEDFRTDVDRALTFAEPPRVNAPVMQVVETAKSEGPEAFAFSRNFGAFGLSGRLDLNQRPLALQRHSLSGQEAVSGRKVSHQLAMGRMGIPPLSPSFAGIRGSLAAGLLL
jgi:hypothetical protein